MFPEPKRGRVRYYCPAGSRSIRFNLGQEQTLDALTVTSRSEPAGPGLRLQVELRTDIAIELGELSLEVELDPRNIMRVFINGFQSWTTSREYSPRERIPPITPAFRPFAAHPGDQASFPASGRPGCLHGFTYTYLRSPDDRFSILGSLSERSGYTIFEYRFPERLLRIHKDCRGKRFVGSYAAFDLYLCPPSAEEEAFSGYFRAMGIEPLRMSPCAGWTSWYYHYTRISEEIVLSNLAAFSRARIPLELFQIDDGYQSAVGDWLETNSRFPSGLKVLAQRIRDQGYRPGLWLAPFVCESRSNLYRNHPDWLLRDHRNRPVRAGINPGWSWSFYALDLYNEEFRAYLREVFQRVLRDWGFDLVKLDFLYAAALKVDSGRTRGQVMCDAMDYLRELASDKLILGCGVPLGPAFGRVDCCRIGSDVAESWETRILRLLGVRERLSTRNALVSTIGRRQLGRRAFLNDPDVFILRRERNRLSAAQRYTLLLVNAIFGDLLLTSDDISRYGEEELRHLRSLFPLRKRLDLRVRNDRGLYRVRFGVGERRYEALLNLRWRRARVCVEEGVWFGTHAGIVTGPRRLTLAHGQSLCLLRISGEPYQLAGCTRHIFPGSCVEELVTGTDGILLRCHDQAHNPGEVYVTVPDDTRDVMVNGRLHRTERRAGVNLVTVRFTEREGADQSRTGCA
ncbi:glycoside hydrolase family 36 protein [Planctomycetota bacterium]